MSDRRPDYTNGISAPDARHTPAERRMLLASELAHLADELADVCLELPDHRTRLNELGQEIIATGHTVYALAEEVG
jgi:hypothetical protein